MRGWIGNALNSELISATARASRPADPYSKTSRSRFWARRIVVRSRSVASSASHCCSPNNVARSAWVTRGALTMSTAVRAYSSKSTTTKVGDKTGLALPRRDRMPKKPGVPVSYRIAASTRTGRPAECEGCSPYRHRRLRGGRYALPMLRSVILAAARSSQVERLIDKVPLSRDLVSRFVPGTETADALRATGELVGNGLAVTLDYLGEDTTNQAQAEATRDEYLRLLDGLAAAELTPAAEISLKLSALGQVFDEKLAEEYARTICVKAT